jgi:peptidoglycan/xylan/chitin deacetylase (PgdA/CDA1 family)
VTLKIVSLILILIAGMSTILLPVAHIGPYTYSPIFPERTVCIIFDDGTTGQIEAAKVLQRYGYVATFAVITGRAGVGDYMSWCEIEWLNRVGMDVESHSVNHLALTRLDNLPQIFWGMWESRRVLEAHGFAPVAYVYPFGAGSGNPIIRWFVSLVYLAARGSWLDGSPFTGDTRYDIHGCQVNPSVTIAQFAAMVNVTRGVPVLVYHKVEENGTDTYTVSPGQFAEEVGWLSSHGYSTTTLKHLITGA